jgi:single-strand DNA-binding protein
MSTASITICGRINEVKVSPSRSGSPVVSLSIPTDSGFGDRKRVTWWRVTIFGKAAETAEKQLSKGSWVCITGTPFMSSFDKRDGTKGLAPEVEAFSWSHVGDRRRETDEPRSSGRHEEEIPF